MSLYEQVGKIGALLFGDIRRRYRELFPSSSKAPMVRHGEARHDSMNRLDNMNFLYVKIQVIRFPHRVCFVYFLDWIGMN